MLACAAMTALCSVPAAAGQEDATTREILALERTAMDGFQAGNPDPFLAIADPDITYFHVMTEKRIDGLTALRALVEPYRGRPLFESYEMAAPKVQASGDLAVLTYILVRHVGGDTSRWNATVIYQKKKDGWRVIHCHWSTTRT